MLNYKFQRNSSYEILSFETAGQCVNNMLAKPDVIILDYKMLGKQILEVSKMIKERTSKSSVIILLEPDDQTMRQDLPKEVSYDYLVKDKDSTKMTDMLIQRILNSVERKEYKNQQVRQKMVAIYIAVTILMVALVMFYFKWNS